MSRVHVRQHDDKRLHIEVHGVLNLELAREFQDVVAEKLTSVTSRRDLLVDLRGVATYDAQARSVLAATQKQIENHVRRCVYLADRPRLRGMVLYFSRKFSASRIRPLPTLSRAEQWLAEERFESRDEAYERTRVLMKRLFSRGKTRGGGHD